MEHRPFTETWMQQKVQPLQKSQWRKSLIHERCPYGPCKRGRTLAGVWAHIWALMHVTKDLFDRSFHKALKWNSTPSFIHQDGDFRGIFQITPDDVIRVIWAFFMLLIVERQHKLRQHKPLDHQGTPRPQILSGKTDRNRQLPVGKGLTQRCYQVELWEV